MWEYAYTTGALGAVLDTIIYDYGNESWGDLLTSYDGNTITYDTIGNPLSDGTWTYTWEQGRKLTKMQGSAGTWNYTYNSDGMRISRTSLTDSYSYWYDGDGKLLRMKYNDIVMSFSYSASGQPMSITYDGTVYYYLLNAQGDVVGLIDSTGAVVVQYTYDAWGRLLSTTGTAASALGINNPLRYRGYIYDTETSFYYLQSRYYNPEMGRFINADDVLSGIGGKVLGYNQFAYGFNNPVNTSDSSGKWASWITGGSGITAVVRLLIRMESTSIFAIKDTDSQQSSFSFVNHVQMSHITSPELMLDLGPLWGKAGLSTTKINQNKTPGLLYSYADVGNDCNNYGAGINLLGWLGVDVGASTEGNFYGNIQLTPFIHGGASVGLDGVGINLGIDVNDTAYDLNLKCGWGILVVLLSPQLATNMQTNTK